MKRKKQQNTRGQIPPTLQQMNKAEMQRFVEQTAEQQVSNTLRRLAAEKAKSRKIARSQEVSAEQARAFDLLKSLRFRALGDEDTLIVLAYHARRAMLDALEVVQKAQTRLKAIERERTKPRQEPKRPSNPKKIKAAWHNLYDALWNGVATMNCCAIKAPELFRPFATRKLFWPVIKSPHIGFNQGEISELKLFKQLSVGDKSGLRIVGGKWKPDDTAGKKALELWQRIDNARCFPPALDDDDKELLRTNTQLLDKERMRESQELREKLRLRDSARKLPEFLQPSEGNKPAGWWLWWKVAKTLLKAEFADPVKYERLKRIVTAPTKQKSPGRIKAHLLVTLRDRFKSMAGANKTR